MDRREELKRQLMITFQAELEEHLGTLNKGLLALEEGPPQEEREPLLADLFRTAHSLKGAARAESLRDIETISHQLEDVLGAIQRGELSPTPALFDALFPAVDALREAMAAHLRGESLPVQQRDQLLAELEAAARGDIETLGDAETRRQGEELAAGSHLPQTPAATERPRVRRGSFARLPGQQ